MRISSVALLLAFFSGGWVLAQSAAPPAHPAKVITLANSAATIPGPWRFAPGDSPVVNGKVLWAQPAFDDSAWTTMNLAAKAGSVDPSFGTPGFVPGWTKQGFPDLYGYAWYRVRLQVADPDKPLWLKMPNDVDDAYQIYANGHYVGQFGHFSSHNVTLFAIRAFSFPLPPADPDGEIELAIRFYMASNARFLAPDVGGMHQTPILGLASTIHLLQAADEDINFHHHLGLALQAILFLLLAPLALWAWLKSRQDHTFLWLFLALIVSPIEFALTLGSLSSRISLTDIMLSNILLNPLVPPLWIMFWWNWFDLRGRPWIPRVAWLLVTGRILALACVQLPTAGFNAVPRAWLTGCNSASAMLLGALGVLLLVILIEGFRRDQTEALAAAFPVLLFEFSRFAPFLAGFGFSTQFHPFRVGISTGSIASILMVLVIGVLVLRRFLRTQVHEELARQSVAKELERAHELQQRVLVPETLHSPFFAVEAEYRPAQTVGGDFFQTLTKPNGSLLVVIGDVSGKGVSAAMLVAVLVGAIRSRSRESFDPASLLEMLNECLLGRSGGHFATCLAAELSPDGTVRLANAGHLPPYLNGKEVEMEGSLPLGVSDKIETSVSTLTLPPGGHLTFLTDGVLEATSATNELFGFERTRAVSSLPAAAIVEQAQRFGQEDDITVLSVDFAAVAEPV